MADRTHEDGAAREPEPSSLQPEAAADLRHDFMSWIQHAAERKCVGGTSRIAQVALLSTLGLGVKQIASITETSVSNINRCLSTLRDRAGWTSAHDGLRSYMRDRGVDFTALLAEYIPDPGTRARAIASLCPPPRDLRNESFSNEAASIAFDRRST